MRLREFFFSLQIDEGTPGTDVIADLAARVLSDLGYASNTVDETVGSLRQVLDARTPDAACGAQFRTGEGALQMIVAWGDGHGWRRSLHLP